MLTQKPYNMGAAPFLGKPVRCRAARVALLGLQLAFLGQCAQLAAALASSQREVSGSQADAGEVPDLRHYYEHPGQIPFPADMSDDSDHPLQPTTQQAEDHHNFTSGNQEPQRRYALHLGTQQGPSYHQHSSARTTSGRNERAPLVVPRGPPVGGGSGFSEEDWANRFGEENHASSSPTAAPVGPGQAAPYYYPPAAFAASPAGTSPFLQQQ
ncbi:unnamed protein product, partial [Amoebophrya sp. A120]|eukprot:GSA120T00024084001.1